MARVAVTGAAGFIGGYVVERLLDEGHEVVGLDNLSKYGPVSRSYHARPAYRLVEGDACDPAVMEALLEGCDHLIAGAAMVGGISYFHRYPYDLLATNDRILASTCDAALRAHHSGRLKKVTYISSSMVYESANRWPSREGDELEIPPPRSSYGLQKLATEYFARAAWDQHRLPYTIVRPFNCVGIGERRAVSRESATAGNVRLATSHVVPDLVQKVVRGENPLHILGDGTQVRHYTYGGDLGRGIVLAMEHDAAWNEDFNLAAPTSTTVLELAALIWSKINGDVRFRYVSDEPYRHDVARRVPDVSKARDLLGFETKVTLDEMLDEVIPWVAEEVRTGRL
jgi:UDP-glucose 4-epimerase